MEKGASKTGAAHIIAKNLIETTTAVGGQSITGGGECQKSKSGI